MGGRTLYIQSLHIYGYGKIIDQQFHVNNGLHVFYGENEAGKSTILSFIHSILFGFPTKVQAENRYEPKTGVKYGGKITIHTDRHRTVTIERIAGKSTGDVTVYFEDGQVGKDTELNELLHGMDKQIFTSIYSFGMKGLQDIHSLKEDDLNNFLFSSSVLGNEQVAELEKRIIKEMDQLFKPSGKKPEINQEIEKLTAFSNRVSEAKQQIETYQYLNEEEQKLEEKLTSVKKQLVVFREITRKLQLFEQYDPYRVEYTMIEGQQEKLQGYSSFPPEGIKRLELILGNLLPLQAREEVVETELAEIHSKISMLTINEQLLQLEGEIKEIALKLHLHEEDKSSLERIQAKINFLHDDILSVKASLGINSSNEQLVELDFTLSRKEKLRREIKQYEDALYNKEVLIRKQEEATEKLERISHTINQYEQQLLPQDERDKLEAVCEHTKNPVLDKVTVQTKLSNITNQLMNYKRRAELGKKVSFFLLIPLFLLTLLIGILNVSGELFIGITFIVISGILALMTIFTPRILREPALLKMLQHDKVELEKQLMDIEEYEKVVVSNQGVMHSQQLLDRDHQLKQLLQQDKLIQAQLEKEVDGYIDQLEAMEQEYHEISFQLEKSKERLFIPKEYSHGTTLTVYEHLEQLASKIKELQQQVIEMENLKERIAAFEKQYKFVQDKAGLFLPPLLLLDTVEKEKEKERQLEALKEKEADIQHNLALIRQEVTYYHTELKKLFDAANTDGEEAYRRKANLHSEWVNFQTRKEAIMDKIKLILNNDEQLENELELQQDLFRKQLEERESLAKQYKEYEDKEEELRKLLAEVVVQKTQLEQSGTYSQLVHQFEVMKTEFTNLARKWAKLSIAKDLITKTKHYYQHVRLPSVMKKAEEYFRLLTANEYHKLFAPQDQGSFIVERNDGTRFSPQELSQGTTEQLFLSLRLALAESYQTPITFPIFIDDSFVNFDEARRYITLKLLKKLSSNRQIVFFTCHKEMVDQLNAVTFTNLSSMKVPLS
ncbi:AAA family ATPase [Bacillus sp. BGMRC 2118]|nr:AAA family ATPase [Bacillus sp. BGMRC 2118]